MPTDLVIRLSQCFFSFLLFSVVFLSGPPCLPSAVNHWMHPNSRLAVLREEYAETTLERRKEAEEVRELMKDHVARKIEAERAKNGESCDACIYSLSCGAQLPSSYALFGFKGSSAYVGFQDAAR